MSIDRNNKKGEVYRKTSLQSTIKIVPLTEGGTTKTAKITWIKLTERLLASMKFIAG
jgi:hypothetical protein